MSSVPRITVVIPNWNGKEFLEVCLPSLRKQEFEDFEVIVVDNGSEDGSREFVEANFPEARFILLGKNRGFSAAANTGVRASGSELVALLNNDTRQEAGWLSALARAADSHPEAGSFASRMLDLHDPGLLDGAGDALRKSGLPYRIGHGERDRGQYDEPRHIFGACAAAALYRREMLDEIGAFDEDFFAYCEDGDLSFRAQLAGYRCLYAPDAVVYHVGSASSGGKRSATATRLGTRNGILLLVKNLPSPLVWPTLPCVAAGQLLRLLTAIATGTLGAHLAGLAGAARTLPPTLEKRKRIQSGRLAPDEYIRNLLRSSSWEATASILRRLTGRAWPRV
jgi:GT2 family glycosyltransferase